MCLAEPQDSSFGPKGMSVTRQVTSTPLQRYGFKFPESLQSREGEIHVCPPCEICVPPSSASTCCFEHFVLCRFLADQDLGRGEEKAPRTKGYD